MSYRSLLLVALLITATSPVFAGQAFSTMNRAQIRSEIKARCQKTMASYGDTMVLACMRQNWSAAQKIQSQEKSHPQIAEQCLGQMRDYGFAMVEACIEQNADAQNQIKNW